MSEDTSLRNRKPPSTSLPVHPSTSAEEEETDLSTGISATDVLRVLSGLLLLSTIFSWFVTDGESITWGYRVNALRWNNLKGLFKPPLVLTDAQLSKYSGHDPSLPIYVAINGSVFDVSAAPQTYGPGGGYGFFAGKDAARAFVSGCFGEDLTWDLRGLEEMFITGKEREEDERESGEIERLEESSGMEGRVRYLKKRREKRRKMAWEKVEKAVDHWEKFFRNHDKYFYVGKVLHPDLSDEPIRKLCKADEKP